MYGHRYTNDRVAGAPVAARILLALLALPLMNTVAADEIFDHYVLETGVGRQQTLLTGFFSGGETADIAVLDIGDGFARRLRIYSFSGRAWGQILETELRSTIRFVDVARVAGRDRLVTYDPGQLYWFDPDAKQERPLLRTEVEFNVREPLKLPHVSIARDLTGNGQDDLVLPAVEGFHVATQRDDGAFAPPVLLGPPEPFRDQVAFGGEVAPDDRPYGEVGFTAQTNTWYQSRVHSQDYDGDGRIDLLFWNGDHFAAHRQRPDGTFDPTPATISLDAPFDAEGLYSLAFGLQDIDPFRLLWGLRGKSRRTVLFDVRDISDNGVVDLVTLTVQGRSLLRQRYRYDVYYGHRTASGIEFETEPGTSIRPRETRTALGYSILTFHDNLATHGTDALVVHVRTSVAQLARVFIHKSIALDVSVFRTEDGRFPSTPNLRRRVKTVRDAEAGPFFPPVLLGDVTGDGYNDLLAGLTRRELHVFTGGPLPSLFSTASQVAEVHAPNNEAFTYLVQLNRYGRKDVLSYHPSDTGHRITVLLSR